jgi:hypothetical protein
MPLSGQAAPLRVERVDLHWSPIDSQETEVNLAGGDRRRLSDDAYGLGARSPEGLLGYGPHSA